ncbi:MAG TPA: DNA-binding protein [Polyangiaceae bacterium]|nr:DNA-binding protein [Polyangiaceae bacterium]
MPSSVESDIRSRVEAFVEDLTAMIRASALDLVNEALGEGGSRPGRKSGGRRAAAAAPVARRAKGAKRDPKMLAALTDRLGDYIKKNPGQRIEQIGKSLGTPTKDLALPVKKLLAAKKISTKGQKRATTYFGR